ncbi:acyl transferase/acyl hydrolase/lysophospholipase [Crucibulum laeve]|uniref:Acyl transferase/acyl hydrolase/lysophospholipase n=1 Tax=Crucibulum laeve TaxID=68775 RepID=A0A5C3ME47_9AGAR|nr:acyl transferase/acyl hydrolase/lysophospholipase [Crucibulum laeve]
MSVNSKSPLTLDALIEEDFVNESHVQAFSDALHSEEPLFDHYGEVSSQSIPGTPVSNYPNGSRIRKVSALSDFAPVNLRVKRRKKKEKHDKRHDWLFLLLRWPLLCFIFLFITAEFGLYVLIRQLVNAKEWVTAWRGQKGVLRRKLRAAQTYEEWKDAAVTLDRYLHFDEWKRVDEDPYYDWKLIRKVRLSLKTLREKKDTRGCLGVLETCIRSNFAAVESPRLYSETFLGTKLLIESYFDELEKSLEYIRETLDLSIEEKKRFFKSANTNLGISALCLSGGASFGYYHCGVVRAFLDAGLLPRVITGTSAGGLIAALTCTRTDDELKVLLVPELADRITACEEPFTMWIRRVWKTGARFDSVLWARKCSFFTRGSMTFREAYTRTGRILNISVIPADRHSPTKLLNYMTAPDTVIWSALLASAAVPGILNPVVLMQKLKDGSIVPWSWGSRFKDGSLRVDIPLQALNLYFNVTHPVVSQVNPHVHLFFFAPRGSAGKPVAHRKGKGWRGNFLLSAAEQWLKHELTKNFKVIRDLELLPQLLGQDWSSVFLQRFDGAVTIWPRTRFLDWIHILTDPDRPELERMIRVGKMVTWPKLHMIENRARIEKQIFLGRHAVRRSLRLRARASVEPRSLILQKAGAETHPDPDIPPLSNSPSPPPTGSDLPLSVDTDAEAAFSRGSRWFFRRGRVVASPSPEADVVDARQGGYHDPLGSSTIRRKWASDLLKSASNIEEPVHRSLANSEASQGHSKSTSSSFLSRLRANSLSNLKLPFYEHKSSSRRDSSVDVRGENGWSSESSSDDEFSLDERRLPHRGSLLNFSAVDLDGQEEGGY